MTMPAEPATGDPAPATGDPSQQPTNPPADPGQQPATGDDWATLFEGEDPAEVRRALDNSRKWENRAKNNKKALDELQAKSQPAPPAEGGEDWKARYEAEQQRATEAAERAGELAYRDAVRTAATTAKADADALLDSSSFYRDVMNEVGDEFDDDDLRAAVEKHAKAYARKARFAAQPTGAGRGSGDFPGSTGAGKPITEEQLAKMSADEIAKAYEAGKLNHLM